MTDVQPRPKRRKKPGQSTIANKNAATRLHAEIVRARGYCELFGSLPTLPSELRECDGPLECAHLIRRSRAATRTDLTNAVCACRRHHTFIDTHLAALITFVGLEEYERLQRKADAGIQGSGLSPLLFWRREREELTALAKRMGLR